jgi:SAM-dependent methyltransferase
MKTLGNVGLCDVQAVYGGSEGRLWELVMGQQIHLGGFHSSMDLAEKAEIGAGTRGVDLCCCTGAGMRFLVRFRNVAHMCGVDATEAMIRLGCQRSEEEGLADRTHFVLADACQTGLPSQNADFVWGEDAWCYVADKRALLAEAARLVKPGGRIAFTDWIEGPAGLTDAEAERYLRFMKFPNVLNLDEYRSLLEHNGCEVLHAEDTGRFAPCADLYLKMLDMQLTGDALRIINFDLELLQALDAELHFVRDLACAGKIAQGLFVGGRK